MRKCNAERSKIKSPLVKKKYVHPPPTCSVVYACDRSRCGTRRARSLIPESTSNKWHSFPGNEAKCNAAKMDGRHLCILGIVDLAQQGPIKRTIKRRLTPRAVATPYATHGQKPSPLFPGRDPRRFPFPRTSLQDSKSEARRSLADLKDFVNGVTLPRCYGVVTAGASSRRRSTTTEAPIDARISRFGYLPLMRCISLPRCGVREFEWRLTTLGPFRSPRTKALGRGGF